MPGPRTQGGGRGRRDRDDSQSSQPAERELHEVVVRINRSAAVVKGGRRFSFSALVVVGDGRGRVGVGFGKAKDVTGAVEKGTKDAKRNMGPIAVAGTTIPHEMQGRCGASRVTLRPAPAGRGIIACAAVRAVFESAGVQDIVTKSLGSHNPVNLIKATLDAISKLRTRDQVESLRGVKLS